MMQDDTRCISSFFIPQLRLCHEISYNYYRAYREQISCKVEITELYFGSRKQLFLNTWTQTPSQLIES